MGVRALARPRARLRRGLVVGVAALALVSAGCGASTTGPGPLTAASTATGAPTDAAPSSDPVAVPQLAPRLTQVEPPSAAQVGAPVEARFSLLVDGEPLAGRAVTVTVDQHRHQLRTDAEGTGTLVIEPGVLAAGSHPVVAEFAGDATYRAASARGIVRVEPATTTLVLTLEPTPTGGTSVRAAVSSATGIAADGVVTFVVDGQPAGEAPVLDAAAQVDLLGLGVGDHTVTARFAATDPTRLAGTEASAAMTVERTATSLTAATSPPTVRYGDTATFEITVTASGPAGDLAGPVTVRLGEAVVAEGTTDATGRASLPFYNTASPGQQTYRVSFGGSAAVLASEVDLTVQTTPTNADLAINVEDDLTPGSDAAIAIAVIGTPDPPTGEVRVSVDGLEVARTAIDAEGRTRVTVPAVKEGEHQVEVAYAGDSRFEATAASVAFTVRPPLANPNAAGAAAVAAGNPCPAAASACVDLSAETAWLQSGGAITYGPVPITSGMAGYRTHTGMFSVFYKNRDHRSSLFNDAPMPNSVFFDGDIAFHQGSLAEQSHGCIHLSGSASSAFYDSLGIGENVYVFGAPPY